MTQHYHSRSKGPVPIATMNYNHAVNAREALLRSDPEGKRAAEYEAICDHIANIDAMAEEEIEL